jgi:hypothetical protein
LLALVVCGMRAPDRSPRGSAEAYAPLSLGPIDATACTLTQMRQRGNGDNGAPMLDSGKRPLSDTLGADEDH